jgi:hypothetical protein
VQSPAAVMGLYPGPLGCPWAQGCRWRRHWHPPTPARRPETAQSGMQVPQRQPRWRGRLGPTQGQREGAPGEEGAGWGEEAPGWALAPPSLSHPPGPRGTGRWPGCPRPPLVAEVHWTWARRVPPWAGVIQRAGVYGPRPPCPAPPPPRCPPPSRPPQGGLENRPKHPAPLGLGPSQAPPCSPRK